MLYQSDPEDFARRETKIHSGGAAELQVIFDFDHTLTRFILPDGSEAPMCHDLVETCPRMPEAFREGYAQLWADQRAGAAAGTWDMNSWWMRSHALMVEHGLQKKWLSEAVSPSGMCCRDGCRELFELLQQHGVPIMVFSAGLRDVIVETLAQAGISESGVQLCANTPIFDKSSKIIESFAEPLITSVNKSQLGIWKSDYFAGVARRHIIIVGDSLTDCKPLENIQGLEESIRIGFWDSRKKPGDLCAFQNVFDLVVSNEELKPPEDLSLKPVIDLLQRLLADEPAGSSCSSQ